MRKNELNLNVTKDFNSYLTSKQLSVVEECVKHFSKRARFVEDDFDERYLYTEEELNLFVDKNTNPEVKITVEYKDALKTEVFCYILHR